MLAENQELDFRNFLKDELASRVSRNPKYSMRALSKQLGLSPSFLSQVMNAQRSLSSDKAIVIADRLKWRATKKRLFLALVDLKNAKNPVARIEKLTELEKIQGKPCTFSPLEMDKFRYIAEWYHMAILELTTLPEFDGSPPWIARRLSIREVEAKSALERLFKLGLLKREGEKVVKSQDNRISDIPSQALRAFHKQMLKKAVHSIENQEFTRRNISGTTLSIDPTKLQAAYEKIRQFRQDLAEFLDSGPKSAIYQLNVQLFQLDTGEK